VRLPRRPTVRARLALLLAGLVVLTGAALLTASYLLVGASVRDSVSRASTCVLCYARSVSLRANISGLLAEYGLMLAVLIVIACGLAWLAAGRMLRPLRQITDTARRITGEDLHQRLALDGPADELTELGGTFDAMLGRLETSFIDQQLFAANVAHELRTPLAVMRAELDLLLTGPQPAPAEVRDTATRLRQTVLSSERILERLLTLSRAMLAPEERERVPLDQVASAGLAAIAETARARGLTIRSELRGAPVYGDPSLLGELAANLIDNAVKYNGPGGWISAATRTDGDRVILEVSNSGPRVDDTDLETLAEPFRRAGQQRTGNSSGLGLSIVRTIATAHDGELRLRALPEGGLAVRVTLPAVPGGSHGPGAGQPTGHADATPGRPP
jgi:signal transduction histidine kinase